jgi:acetyl esterase/lipase
VNFRIGITISRVSSRKTPGAADLLQRIRRSLPAMSHAYDPELATLVEMLPTSDIADIGASRAQLDALLEPLNQGVDTTGVTVEHREVPGPAGAPPVPVIIHTPEGEPTAPLRPALLDIHGGGFALGHASMELAFATQVARQIGAVVVAPDYRLAPEHPFPAGLEDCYATLEWMASQASGLGIDPERIAVGGQSAGGGLSAAVALLSRDRGGPALCFQFLGIPELDHRLETTSMRMFTDTPLWHRRNAELSWAYYLGDHTTDVSPYASPAIADDLSGLPPAFVTTMEFDPLRDEGILYALRLMEAGISVELHSYPGTFHGSAMIQTAEVSRREAAELLQALTRGLRAIHDE